MGRRPRDATGRVTKRRAALRVGGITDRTGTHCRGQASKSWVIAVTQHDTLAVQAATQMPRHGGYVMAAP